MFTWAIKIQLFQKSGGFTPQSSFLFEELLSSKII